MTRTKENPGIAVAAAPGMKSNHQQKEALMNNVAPTIRTVDAIEGFQHTVQLQTYDGVPGPEIVVTFGGQGTIGDLHSSREARELALALLAAANDLDHLNGVLTLPKLEQQHADGEPTYLEAGFGGEVGDYYWVCPISPDIAGPGIAVDSNTDDRSPDAVRQLITELSVTLTIVEGLAA